MLAKAEIITIGDEILYGQTLDTNSYWMSGVLDQAGISVIRKTCVGDQKEEILTSISEAEGRADIILITGGLGPTSDDITKQTLVEYFDTRLIPNPKILEHIKSIFSRADREMSDLNIAQADLPENCTPIPNPLGTAAGMWFERHGKIFVSMPGVPYEMKRMMTDSVIPMLIDKKVEDVVHHRMIRTIGVPESQLADLIKPWEDELPQDIKLAYLPTMGTVKLRLTTKGSDLPAMKKKVQAQIDKILPLIGKNVYGFDEEEIEEAIGRMLKERGLKLAIAESCTGGFLSHKITSVAGSSAWFNGSFVPYSNELKNEQLKVSKEILQKDGAVSESVVLALAKNVKEAFNADVAVSISGIAGPGGGTVEKPVGTVWIGYADEHKVMAKKFQFTMNRNLNIKFSAMAALNMIRINLDKN
jgi:nicotinamide-nucleotide amidase